MRPARPFSGFALCCLLAAGVTVGCDDGGGAATEAGDGATGSADASADGGTLGARPTGRFTVSESPAQTPLGQIPFPNDLYRGADGTLDLAGFPRPRPLVELVASALEGQTRGFGTSATMYLSFETPLDPNRLPVDGPASIADDATLYLVDVDPDSAELGRKWPIKWRYQDTPTEYLPANTLRARLLEGLALRPMRTYALVVSGQVVSPSEQFAKVLSEQRPEGGLGIAWDRAAALRSWQAESGAEIGLAAVFTTQDPVSEMFQARTFIHSLPRPVATDIESQGERHGGRVELFHGRYTAPNFQSGTIPHTQPGEGAILFDAAGDPVIQEPAESLRFALSVPLELEMPEGGWPLVLYAHGTGGDFQSFVRSSVSSVLGREGAAVISIDQVQHGERNGGVPCGADCTALRFFNFLIPESGRDNVRQAALDLISLLRMSRGLSIPAELSGFGRAVRFNPEKIVFMGHSQGGLNGPIFMAIEPTIKGGMLSGAGASIAITIEQKTRPFDVRGFVETALSPGPSDTLDRWHPALALLQTFIESGDGVNYARFWFDEPPEGSAPKSIFMTVGMTDEFTPPDTIHAMAAAGRVPIIEPVVQSIPALDLLGIEPAGIPPYKGNVAGGLATAGIAQYPNDGHQVIFQRPDAKQRFGRFLLDLANKDVPNIY